MIGGATTICFVISPGKSDILEYYGGAAYGVPLCYCVQPQPAGLCDAIFRALPVIDRDEPVLVGLPDTIWFPEDGLQALPDDAPLLPAVPGGAPASSSMPWCPTTEGRVARDPGEAARAGDALDLGRVQNARGGSARCIELVAAARCSDEYIGTLVNAWLAEAARPGPCAPGRRTSMSAPWTATSKPCNVLAEPK